MADTGRPENGLSEVKRMLNVSSVGRIDTFKLILLLLLIVVRRRRCVLAKIVKKQYEGKHKSVLLPTR